MEYIMFGTVCGSVWAASTVEFTDEERIKIGVAIWLSGFVLQVLNYAGVIS